MLTSACPGCAEKLSWFRTRGSRCSAPKFAADEPHAHRTPQRSWWPGRGANTPAGSRSRPPDGRPPCHAATPWLQPPPKSLSGTPPAPVRLHHHPALKTTASECRAGKPELLVWCVKKISSTGGPRLCVIVFRETARAKCAVRSRWLLAGRETALRFKRSGCC